ncbi:MAG: hypothetical protein QOG57_3808, partial [Pseudonocardiales bacterium]|nr:hypothetical protein [Pseudonocardiales bacterium]
TSAPGWTLAIAWATTVLVSAAAGPRPLRITIYGLGGAADST